MVFFVAPFLQANSEMSSATNQEFLEMAQNSTTKAYLQTELAGLVDAGEAFVNAIYNLEEELRWFEVLTPWLLAYTCR